MSRTPTTPDAAQAAGVDYLLRKFSGLDMDKTAPDARADLSGSGERHETSIWVASAEATTAAKASADLVCDGIGDEVEIHAARDEIQGGSGWGGMIQLTEGEYNLANPVILDGAVSMKGAGSGITYLSSSAVGSTDSGLVQATDFGVISDLSIAAWNEGYEYALYADCSSGERGTITRVDVIQDAAHCDTIGALGIGGYVHADKVYIPAGGEGDGITYFGSGHVWITDCSVHATNGWGIKLLGTVGKESLVLGNFLDGALSGSIEVGADRCIIVGNYAEDGITITSAANGTIIGLNYGTVTDNGTNTDNITSLSSVLTTKGDLWGFDTADNRFPVGSDGTLIVADSGQALGVKYDTQGGYETEVWGMEGTVTTGTGASRLYAPVGMTLIDFRISLSAGTATVDVNKDGTTVFSTQSNRPVISSGNVSSLATPDVTSVAADSYLTIDVDAASSAEDLIVTMRWRKT